MGNETLKSSQPTSRIALVTHSETGMALLMAVFVVAFGSLLVFEFMQEARYDERGARGLAEGVQANYLLKSALNFSTMVLEIPKGEPKQPEAWQRLNNLQTIPIGDVGSPRVFIADEDGKIDLNSIVVPQTSGSAQLGGTGNPPPTTNPTVDFWREALFKLFEGAGFVREKYDTPGRTLGDAGLSAGDQVCAIGDWIDTNTENFSGVSFCSGSESGAPKGWYLNRRLGSIFDVLLVPGMTAERLRTIAPFVRVSQSSAGSVTKINLNSAPLEVLIAMGIDQNVAANLMSQRPLVQSELTDLGKIEPNITKFGKVNSSEFSVYARVTMPNVTKWLRAVVTIDNPNAGKRTAKVHSLEFY